MCVMTSGMAHISGGMDGGLHSGWRADPKNLLNRRDHDRSGHAAHG